MSSNGSPTSFMTTSPPSTKSNILHSGSFILFRGHTFFGLAQLKTNSPIFSFPGVPTWTYRIYGALKEVIPFKYLLFSPHLKLCKLACTRCTTGGFVQCIDSRAITCSCPDFVQFTNLLSNYLERWRERCSWQPREGERETRTTPEMTSADCLSTSNRQHSSHFNPQKFAQIWPLQTACQPQISTFTF